MKTAPDQDTGMRGYMYLGTYSGRNGAEPIYAIDAENSVTADDATAGHINILLNLLQP